jgi:type I restriction enzyme, S subunit
VSKGNGVPENWALTNIGEIAWVTKLAGFEFTKFIRYNEAESVRVVRGLNVGYGEFRATDFKFIDIATANALPRSQLQGGEVLIAYVGSLGTAAILPFDGHRYHLGPNVAKVVVEPNACNAKYLLYFVLSPKGQHQIHTTSKAVAQSSLSMHQIRVFNLPLAPLSEQSRIVDAIEQHFTRLDVGVAALKRAQAALKRYRAAVLKAAVEGKLTAAWRAAHPDVEPASELLKRILAERRAKWEADLRAKGKDSAKVRYVEPEKADATNLPELAGGWCWASVEQVTSYIGNGLSPKPASDPPGHRILRINAVRPMRINMDEIRYLRLPTEEVVRYFLERGDVLFTRYNGSLDLLGVAGMVKNVVAPTLHPDKLIRVRTIRTGILPAYLELASNTGHSRAHIESRARTTAGQTGISGTDIKQMPLPLPPFPEQVQTVAEVERRLSVVSELEATIQANLKRAERLRQSILERAFAGKLVPQCSDDEPASLLLERIRQIRQHEGQCAGNGKRAIRRSRSQLREQMPTVELNSYLATSLPLSQIGAPACQQASLWERPALERGS